MNQTNKLIFLIALFSLALSACNEQKTSKTAEAKVALKVNGQAIRVTELGGKTTDSMDTDKHAISESKMKRLVDMELLRQAAVEFKLDQDEGVRARIASATRTILATAYMEKQLEQIAKPNEADIKAFYDQSPARFAERKQYDIHEFSILPPEGKIEEIQAQLGKSKTVAAFEQWLNDNRIQHSSTPISVTGDRLPDDVLQKVDAAPVGGTIFLGGIKQLNAVFVLAKKPLPLPLAQVEPMVANMLMDKHKVETLDNVTKQLRDKAKVEYMPPYTASGFTPDPDHQ